MQGKTEHLQQFCLPSLTDDEWKREQILDLTQTRKVCPPYLVPSSLDKSRGICVPNYALEPPGTEKATKMSLTLERIQISMDRMLSPDLLLEGAEYILSKAVGETFWEKTWQEYLAKGAEERSFTDRFNQLTGSSHV